MSLDKLNEYLLDISRFPNQMVAGKAKAVLLREQGFSGEVMPRYKYAERCVEEGGYSLDDKRKQFIKPNGCHYAWKDITLHLVDYFDWLSKQHG